MKNPFPPGTPAWVAYDLWQNHGDVGGLGRRMAAGFGVRTPPAAPGRRPGGLRGLTPSPSPVLPSRVGALSRTEAEASNLRRDSRITLRPSPSRDAERLPPSYRPPAAPQLGALRTPRSIQEPRNAAAFATALRDPRLRGQLVPPLLGPVSREQVAETNRRLAFQPAGPDHRAAFFENPMQAYVARMLVAPGEDTTGQDDAGDRNRHAYWGARLGQAFGPERAQYYMDAHEREAPDDDPSLTMDLINGRNMAVLGAALPFMDYRELTKRAIAANLLQEYPVRPPRWEVRDWERMGLIPGSDTERP